MLERKHIEKIAREYGELVVRVLAGDETETDYAGVFEAIADANNACDEADVEFNEARDALARWDAGVRAESRSGSNMDIVRAYFNRSKGGDDAAGT